MDALFDADLVGVDILQYPVDSELSEVNARQRILCRVLGARELIFPSPNKSLQAVTYLGTGQEGPSELSFGGIIVVLLLSFSHPGGRI